MLEFKNPKMEDIEAIQKFLLAEPELSCETNFANLIIWHDYYNTVYYYDDKTLFFTKRVHIFLCNYRWDDSGRSERSNLQ